MLSPDRSSGIRTMFADMTRTQSPGSPTNAGYASPKKSPFGSFESTDPLRTLQDMVNDQIKFLMYKVRKRKKISEYDQMLLKARFN